MQKNSQEYYLKYKVTFSGLAIFFFDSCEEDLAKVNDKKSTNLLLESSIMQTL